VRATRTASRAVGALLGARAFYSASTLIPSKAANCSGVLVAARQSSALRTLSLSIGEELAFDASS